MIKSLNFYIYWEQKTSIKFLFWFNLGARTLPRGGHKRINWIKGKHFCYTNIIVHRFFPTIPFFQITLKIFRLKKEETFVQHRQLLTSDASPKYLEALF